jgi:hypothetical protein
MVISAVAALTVRLPQAAVSNRSKQHWLFDHLVGAGDDEDRELPGRAQLKLLCSGADEYCADGKWGELIDNSVAFPPAPSRRVVRRA